MNSLLRAKFGEQVYLAIRLLYLGVGIFPFFQRLMDEAGYEDKHLLHDISCLPLIGPAPVSGVLSPKSVHATVSLSEFWSKVPQRNVEVFNRVGPTGDTELDRRASDKTHEEFTLGLMDGTYDSLEECPGQHKALVRRKPRWQSGDVRNIDDCSENGINETFESKKTYQTAGIDHHVSAIKQWETSLPGVKLHGFVADLWNHFRQIGIGLNLIVVFWCHNSGSRRFGRLRGCPFGAAACVQGCARLPMAMCALLQHHLLASVQHYQDDHHCLEPSYSVAQAWTLINIFMVFLVQSWLHLVATSFRCPVKFTVCLEPRLTSLSHRVKFKSFPRESIQSVVSSNRSFRPGN